jgi:hypothetical protein
MEKKQLADTYVSFLLEEGYRPRLDDDEDVIFKKEGLSFFILIDPSDPLYFRVVCPNLWEAESPAERVRILEACNSGNSRSKAVKFTLVRNSVWAGTEIFLSEPNAYKPIFERTMLSIQLSVSAFIRDLAPAPNSTAVEAAPPAENAPAT